MTSAQAAAEEVIRAHQVIELAASSTRQFEDAFLHPREPTDIIE